MRIKGMDMPLTPTYCSVPQTGLTCLGISKGKLKSLIGINMTADSLQPPSLLTFSHQHIYLTYIYTHPHILALPMGRQRVVQTLQHTVRVTRRNDLRSP